MKKKIVWISFIAVIITGVVIGSFVDKNKPLEKIGYALDTQIRIVVYDKGDHKTILDNAYNEILRLDKQLSNFNKESETYILNEKKTLEVSNELKEVIESGIDITSKTGGNFDLTIFPLSGLWNYKNAIVPDKEEIELAKEKIGISNIEISGNKITLKNDAKIDVSSTAKGYIADYIIDYLKYNGVKNALVDAGGNIKVMGTPGSKSDSFKIGIKDPDKSSSLVLGFVKLKDKSIVTSGIYERYFTYEDKAYHHIVDPKTGYPSESDVISVSVISKSSVNADGYATAIVVMGGQKGLELVEKTKDIECIIVKKDNTIITSSGVSDFELTNRNYKIGG